jgi:hypothetical protein
MLVSILRAGCAKECGWFCGGGKMFLSSAIFTDRLLDPQTAVLNFCYGRFPRGYSGQSLKLTVYRFSFKRKWISIFGFLYAFIACYSRDFPKR